MFFFIKGLAGSVRTLNGKFNELFFFEIVPNLVIIVKRSRQPQSKLAIQQSLKRKKYNFVWFWQAASKKISHFIGANYQSKLNHANDFIKEYPETMYIVH